MSLWKPRDHDGGASKDECPGCIDAERRQVLLRWVDRVAWMIAGALLNVLVMR